MKIAFYAPMKPPDDPTPSGDRQLARLIIGALEDAGHKVILASRLRSWVREPYGGAQERMAAEARAEADRVADMLRHQPEPPDIWITYHLYHKAPDWIGPMVAEQLRIPYVVFEASRALKRKTGPWAFGFAAVDDALISANAVVAMHEDDAEGLRPVVPPDRLHQLAPFIDTRPFQPPTASLPNDPPVLITVAMMRAGDKERSYQVLAEALERLRDRQWRHIIAGDGPARETIAALFDARRTTFTGLAAPDELAALYHQADLFVWPAVREAFGLVFLEAQAAGLAVVGGRAGGVPEIVRDGETGLLATEGDVDGFTEALDKLLTDPGLRRRMSVNAARHAKDAHDIGRATSDITAILASAADHHARAVSAFSPFGARRH